MTWADIFKRLWLVIRSRALKHRTCGECGWLLTKRGITNLGETVYVEECEDCKELERLEGQKLRDLSKQAAVEAGYRARPSWVRDDPYSHLGKVTRTYC